MPLTTLEEIRQRTQRLRWHGDCLANEQHRSQLYGMIEELAQHVEALQKPTPISDPDSLVSSWTWTCPKCGYLHTGRGSTPPSRHYAACLNCNRPKTRGEEVAKELVQSAEDKYGGVNDGIYVGDRMDSKILPAGCSKIAETVYYLREILAGVIDRERTHAAKEEREACAKLADNTHYNDNAVAKAIRARK